MLSVIVPVVVGAIIGYGTNWIAIKMLFWPRSPKFLLGRKVPMTPGLFVRRRKAFAAAIAELIEQRFTGADDLRRLVASAQEEGAVKELLSKVGPILNLAFRAYAAKTTPESFRQDCKMLADALERSGVVYRVVRMKIDNMPTEEIEDMVLAVVRKELRVITYLGGVIGAVIGLLQGVLV